MSIAIVARQAGLAAGVAFVLSAIVATLPAEAAPKGAARVAAKSAPAAYSSAKAPTVPAEAPGEIGEAGPAEPGCSKARRKLWVDGEGWIVRRVTTCF